jgi:hypothetical protein
VSLPCPGIAQRRGHSGSPFLHEMPTGEPASAVSQSEALGSPGSSPPRCAPVYKLPGFPSGPTGSELGRYLSSFGLL